ncbi:unnamed protein product [Effrenium voratum]|nr:unnamed protein product [Effrenium voratum]
MACVGWTSVAPCRRGLPFYRFTESALRPGDCFRLCTGKGLDLFGLSDGGECRCGASLLNRQAWRWRKPPPGLALAWPKSRRVRPELCDTRVYRYTGHFEEGGALPTPLTALTQEDLAYVDSIATGRHIYPEEEEDVSRRLEAVVQPGTDVALLSAAKNDCPVTVSCPCTHPDYACYAWYEAGARCACFMINSHTTAENCAQFGGTFCGQDPGPTTTTTTTTEVTTTYTGPSTTVPGPPEGIGWNRSGHESLAVDRWPERRSEPPGSGEDIWQDYAVVRYSFNTTIDALRKNAFRDAVDMWRDKTCVNFVEEENPARPYVLVGIWNPDSCYASVGYYSSLASSSYARVNLGWCKDQLHVGNMAHELGHILGMSHEQKRPDGGDSFYGPTAFESKSFEFASELKAGHVDGEIHDRWIQWDLRLLWVARTDLFFLESTFRAAMTPKAALELLVSRRGCPSLGRGDLGDGSISAKTSPVSPTGSGKTTPAGRSPTSSADSGWEPFFGIPTEDTLRRAEPVATPAEPERTSIRMKPANKFEIQCMLRALLEAFTDPWVQEQIYELRSSADHCAGRRVRGSSQASGEHSVDPEGYYNLSGRTALALLVHEQVLPRYAFEGTPEGVQEMLLHVSPYLGDKDVARLFDAINSKLGMEPNAQRRFRRLVASAEDVDPEVLRSCSPRRRAASNSPSRRP